MGARGLGLVARFGLTIYLARYLPLSQVGLFGLTAGLAGFVPALSGLGLNFFLSRELVGKERYDAAVLIRDRLSATICVMGAMVGIGLLSWASGTDMMPKSTPLICAIVFLETIAFDLHMCLISLRKPLLANMLLFIRSAVWAFPAIVLGMLYPPARSLEVILWFWLGGLLVYYGVLAIGLRSWPVRRILNTQIEWRGMGKIVRRGWLIYINDLGISGTLYLDRYVVAHILGLRDVGLYTLYWNIANGLHVLVTAAIVQVSAPHLIAAFRSSEEEWRKNLETHLLKIVFTVVPLALIGFGAVIFLMPRLGVHRLGERPDLFALMLIGISLRLVADMLNYGLYSRNLDRQLAWINIGGLALAITMNFTLLSVFGLIGAGISMTAVPLTLGIARLAVLHRHGATLPFRRLDNHVQSTAST